MKKILALLGVGFAASTYYGFKKVNEIKVIVRQLQTSFASVHNINFDVINNHVSFLTDLVISNPTNSTLNLDTQAIITLEKLLFYDANNNLIATASINITELNINPLSSIRIDDVPIEMTISSGITQLQKTLSNIEENKVKIVLELKALNQTFTTSL